MGLEMRLKALEALALIDGDFRKRLLDDPLAAARDLDIDLSAQQVEGVRRAKEVLERYAHQVGKHGIPDHGIPGNMVMSVAKLPPPPPPPPLDRPGRLAARKRGA